MTDQGIVGIGEIAPLPELSGGSLADAQRALPALKPRLQGNILHEALHILTTCVEGENISAPTLCGLEIALLDALGKAEGCSIGTLLGRETHSYHAIPTGFVPRSSVAVNALVGGKPRRAAVAAALKARADGFRCIKLKVGICDSQEQEIERVAAVREAVGPTMHLRLDANEAWTLNEAIAILSRLVPYDIQYIEQPVKAEQLANMHTLRQELSIPIAADEAITGLQSARSVLDAEAADVLIVKPQLAGGLRVGQQILQEAAERGVQGVVTSTLETGIGLVAALHLAAASPTLTMACGLATLSLLAEDFLVDDLPIHNGVLTVPSGPGLGVVVDRAYK